MNPLFPSSRFRFAAAAALAAAMMFSAPAVAQSSGEASPENKPLVLLELFTSQGCYSCPPAEKLLADELSRRPELLALEMHVDYWDDLVYGFHGSWKDPFSSPQFSERQFAYNRKIRGHNGGYTPQIIVHGNAETGGAQKHRILKLAAKAAETPPDLQIQFSGNAKDGFAAEINGAVNDGMRLMTAVFLKRETTKIDAGENDGKTLVNVNIVTNLQSVPATRRRAVFPTLDPERESCAVWIQRGGGVGPVVAAARCPGG